ncbi:MAG: hypothetical protein JRH17_18545 [Deltaproteobacteria bacterium]|jgi:uncharacterized protein YhhL (DUF1145 family)|nr:hypothetical protein [Deltaproteobacteria bacterium]
MYSERQLRIGRILVALTWIFALASWFFPLYYTSIGNLGRALFYILTFVHLVEFPLFLKTYRAAGGSLFGQFLRHMAYGVLHHTEVKQRLAQRA